MKISDLKNLISDLDDDSEVRIASQPSWPFEYEVASVEVVDLAEGEGDPETCPLEVVYLVSGDQMGYLPQQASSAIGWS